MDCVFKMDGDKAPMYVCMCKSCARDDNVTVIGHIWYLTGNTVGLDRVEERADCDASGRYDASGRGVKARQGLTSGRMAPNPAKLGTGDRQPI
jgi:hypothetical protein